MPICCTRVTLLLHNEYVDITLPTVEGAIRAAAKLYAGDFDLKNPLISPLYGDFEGFPPTYLVSGTRDLLLSDTIKVHRKLRDAGVVADLNVFEGIPHGAYLAAPGSSEFEAAMGDLKKFLETHLREFSGESGLLIDIPLLMDFVGPPLCNGET